MSKASTHRTPEQNAQLKIRFDRFRKRTRGQGRHPALGSPMSGKNRSQRQRLQDAFNRFLPSKGAFRL